MTDAPDDENNPLRDHAETIRRMTTEAQRIERRLKADACIVICLFKDGNQLRIQDAGRFPMPPEQFYEVIQAAHCNGQLGHNSPKLKPTTKIIKPH